MEENPNFYSGSNGTFEAINIPADATVTLDMPPDAIFHATTINVAANAILKFNPNPLNTPVYLLATGDITIDGTIDVSGEPGTTIPAVGGAGGPGGFDGGSPGFGLLVPPSAGLGPGGGRGGTPDYSQSTGVGRGAYAGAGTQSFGCTAHPTDGAIYGSALLIPLVRGSDGGGTTGFPGFGGSGGGGAIMLASSTRITVSGSVQAIGGEKDPLPAGTLGPGSGGAIRIVAPIVDGAGVVNVLGGRIGGNGTSVDRGGWGRVRIDLIDRTDLRLTTLPGGILIVGAVMKVFPEVIQRLDIVQAAGQTIPEGQAEPIFINLPFGSTASRTVTVQARGFLGLVPIKVVLIPETGDPFEAESVIDMTLGDPSSVEVNVTIFENTLTRIMVWTR